MRSVQPSRGSAAVRAREAAKSVFDWRFEQGDVQLYEPGDREAAKVAVNHLGELYDKLPGMVRSALDAARGGAEVISSDQLQFLSEIIQNADDVQATQVRVHLGPSGLSIAHDGRPVQLQDILALATPWLSTKTSDPGATGRFGIGLSTLEAVSSVLEVHCDPYHARLAGTRISAIPPSAEYESLGSPGWTVLHIPLPEQIVTKDKLLSWFDRWGDGALLFLRYVSRIELLEGDFGLARVLQLTWEDRTPLWSVIDDQECVISRRVVRALDGRAWSLYGTEVRPREGVERTHKAVGATTPIAVAFPLGQDNCGYLHAGLPVRAFRPRVRINAQFDPLTSRQELADTLWNRALVPLVGQLWTAAMLDLFHADPVAAWDLVPLPETGVDDTASPIVRALEESLLASARNVLSARLDFTVPDLGRFPLAQLAVEAYPLEGVIGAADIAALAGLAATLPLAIRGSRQQWRRVLDDWRQVNTLLPAEVDVRRALSLLDHGLHPVSSVVSLVAVGLAAGLDNVLKSLACIVTADGLRMSPPGEHSEVILTADPAPLAAELGIRTRLHDAFLADSNGARRVLKWLCDIGAVLESGDDLHVLRRLAAMGAAGFRMSAELTDEQVKALRLGFEQLSAREQARLGPGAGQAIMLRAYSYRNDGTRRLISAPPGEVYLPKRYESEPDSFAVAAAETPGLKWLHSRYADVLRSGTGRSGLGALRFLRLLGAATTPRIVPYPSAVRRFSSDGRRGVTKNHGPAERQQALGALGASYTLEDRESPDLQKVLENIADDDDAERRIERAAAVIATLGRSWDRLKDQTEVEAVYDYYGWQLKGHTPALWVWGIRTTAWLSPIAGRPARPMDLCFFSPATLVIFGSDTNNYIHHDLAAAKRPEVFAALGVRGEPSLEELLNRLRELRTQCSSQRKEPVSEEAKTEAALVYQALAHLAGEARSGAIRTQLATPFREEELVLTRHGWRSSSNVFRGSPIFGDLRAFTPQIPQTEKLWQVLDISEPTAHDAVNVLRELSRAKKAPDAGVQNTMLECLRLLVASLKDASPPADIRRKLSRLSLWTTQGWNSQRPIYTADDPAFVEGLGHHVPMWLPGGDLRQFQPLLRPMRITEVGRDDTIVVDPDAGWDDDEAAALFSSAVKFLRDDLVRNDPGRASALLIDWERLATFRVRVQPQLEICADLPPNGLSSVFKVTAFLDNNTATLYVADPERLSLVSGVGQAIAAQFDAERRGTAQAWGAAWEKAMDDKQKATVLLTQLDSQRELEQSRTAIEERTAELQDEISELQASNKHRPALYRPPDRVLTLKSPAPTRDSTGTTPRKLIDPASLRLVNARGQLATGAPPTSDTRLGRPTGSGQLMSPRPGAAAPQSHLGPPSYTALDKEKVGLELVKRLLSSSDQQIIDLRGQHGVGADAVDSLERFYELKVSAGPEPDVVTLTYSEVQRALGTRDFFLIVVSNLEGPNAEPKVRIIINPLEQLSPVDGRGITLSGVRTAHSIIYNFTRSGSQS